MVRALRISASVLSLILTGVFVIGIGMEIKFEVFCSDHSSGRKIYELVSDLLEIAFVVLIPLIAIWVPWRADFSRGACFLMHTLRIAGLSVIADCLLFRSIVCAMGSALARDVDAPMSLDERFCTNVMEIMAYPVNLIWPKGFDRLGEIYLVPVFWGILIYGVLYFLFRMIRRRKEASQREGE